MGHPPPDSEPIGFVRELNPAHLGGSGAWLREHLSSQRISIHPTSELGIALNVLGQARELARVRGSQIFSSVGEGLRFYMTATGADFLTKCLRRGLQTGISGFDAHVRGLCSAGPLLTAPTWAGHKPRSLTNRNRGWELVLASLATTFASDVRAGEPDVLCDFEGQTIGMACKVLYSRSGEQALDMIQSGARQLEASSADVGYVVVNMVEQFPHENLFVQIANGRFASVDEVRKLLEHWMKTFMDQLGPDGLAKHLRGSTKLLSLLFFLPTAIRLDGMDMPMSYEAFHVCEVAGREHLAAPFQDALHQAVQTVLSFE